MGVSGCGKSTVAGALSDRLGWEFAEGDDIHSAANVEKMHSGHPLTDDDRTPWLAEIAKWISAHVAAGRSAIVTCSALKRTYRDVLRANAVTFVYLAGNREQIAQRLASREGHFMPATLLDSQFADLEPPGPDEQSITIGLGESAATQAEQIVTALKLTPQLR
ncbi:MAG: gluconokinase [Jatrophihabitantaceae bacterium]